MSGPGLEDLVQSYKTRCLAVMLEVVESAEKTVLSPHAHTALIFVLFQAPLDALLETYD